MLVNGLPLNGAVRNHAQFGTVTLTPQSPSGMPVRLDLRAGVRLRVTGVIATDSGHDSDPPDLAIHRAEIHPVYQLDVLQDFTQPRPNADLSGVWHANDVGTYYLRQTDGDTLWWFGMSRDQGRSFANVLRARLGVDPVLRTLRGLRR